MRRWLVSLSVLAGLVVGPGPSVAHAAPGSGAPAEPVHDPVVVLASTLNGWELGAASCEGDPAGSSTFVLGPDEPPTGSGSLQLSVGRNAQARRTASYAELVRGPLTGLSELRYSTYVHRDGQVAPVALLEVDLDDDRAADHVLRFDPAITGAVKPTAWQAWDARAGEWSLATGESGLGETFTWDAYLEAHPEAVLNAGGMSLAVGCDEAWAGVVANIDGVSLTQDDKAKTFDFEAEASSFSVADTTGQEGDALDLVVELSRAAEHDVEVSVRSVAGTAGTEDYVRLEERVFIRAGDIEAHVELGTLEDLLDEADETLTVELFDPAGAGLVDAAAVATILDDDQAPELRVGSPTQLEGATGGPTMAVDVTLSSPSGLPVGFSYTAQGAGANPATAGKDFVPVAGSGAIPAGSTSFSVDVPVYADRLVEGDESLTLALSEVTNASVGEGLATVRDDDAGPASVEVEDVSVDEGGQLRFGVSRTGDLAETITVVAVTAAGPAPAAGEQDYTPMASRTLTFTPGQNLIEVGVQTSQDALDESNEQVLLKLSTPTNAVLADPSGTGVIVDDDGPVSAPAQSWLSVGDVQVVEGTGTPARRAMFSVVRSGSLTGSASARVATSALSARAPRDYTHTTGTVSFADRQSVAVVEVPVSGDTDTESLEQFRITLSSAVGARLADASGTASIVDDDAGAPAVLTVADVVASEGTSGSSTALVTVRREGTTVEAVTVQWATTAAAATAGTAATPGVDYTSTSPATLSFAAGEQQKQLAITLAPDGLDEPNEVFAIALTSPTDAALGDASAVVTIVDDEGSTSPGPATFFGVRDPRPVTEGTAVVFDVVRRGDVSSTGSVRIKTAQGTARAGSDFTAIPTYTNVSFAAGQTTRTVTVQTASDGTPEWPETFQATASVPVNGSVEDASAAAIVVDDDDGIKLSATAPAIAETTGGAPKAIITFSLSAVSAKPVSFGFATADGTASSPSDYGATTGSLTFAPGERTKQVEVPVVGDNLDEQDESFRVDVSGVLGATPPAGPVQVTILDDDSSGLSVVASSVSEAAGAATVTVTLSPAAQSQVTVRWSTADASALQPFDYTRSGGTLTFAPGQTTQTLSVPITQDSAYEAAPEQFLVTLSDSTSASISHGSAPVTIEDDDPVPGLSVLNSTAAEDDGTIGFPVVLDRPSSRDVVVNAFPFPGTATQADVVMTPASVVIPAGATSALIPFTVLDGVACEGREQFTVELLVGGSADGASVADGLASGAISDIDCGGLVLHDVWADESAGTAVFTVTLDEPRNVRVSATFATSAGTAAQGPDFTATTGTVRLNAGELTTTITVPLASGPECESPETFTVTLGNAQNAPLVRGAATATIADAHCAGLSVLEPPSTNEGAQVPFVAALSAVSAVAVTVHVESGSGTATSGTDFTPVTTDVVLQPGERFKTVLVATSSQASCEADETLLLTMTSSSGPPIAKATGTGVIHDLSGICLSVTGPAGPVTEGTSAVFTVSAFPAPTAPVTVIVKTAPRNAIPHGFPNPDYHSNTTTLSIPAGTTSRTFSVGTIDSGAAGGCEGPEQFAAVLSDPQGAKLDTSSAVVTIRDFAGDCSATGLTIDNVDARETQGSVTLTVSMPVAASTVTASWTTVEGSASPTEDYVSASGTLTFAPGETSKSVTVSVKDGTGCEPDEVFMVRVSQPSGATIADGWGTVVLDDVDC